MVRRILLILVLSMLGIKGAMAEAERDVRHLMGLLQIQDVLRIMRIEGLKFGAELGEEMLPGGGGAPWALRVSQLYDMQNMEQVVSEEFQAALAQTDPTSLIVFFESALGQRVVSGEIHAREAFLDSTTEAAAYDAIADALQTPRLQQISAYIAANELVEYNVVGALNANYMFYRGLTAGGLLEMTEDEMLAEAWANEAETRAETQEWLQAYLNAAYADLSVEELRQLTLFSMTTEGQALNRALFAGFDRMYEELSLGLGLAMADLGQGEKL